jgi:hypothetical protein
MVRLLEKVEVTGRVAARREPRERGEHRWSDSAPDGLRSRASRSTPNVASSTGQPHGPPLAAVTWPRIPTVPSVYARRTPSITSGLAPGAVPTWIRPTCRASASATTRRRPSKSPTEAGDADDAPARQPPRTAWFGRFPTDRACVLVLTSEDSEARRWRRVDAIARAVGREPAERKARCLSTRSRSPPSPTWRGWTLSWLKL